MAEKDTEFTKIMESDDMCVYSGYVKISDSKYIFNISCKKSINTFDWVDFTCFQLHINGIFINVPTTMSGMIRRKVLSELP